MAWFLRRVLLIAVPVVEVVLIIYVADSIGWLPTLGLLLAGFVGGMIMIRAAGRNAFQMLGRRTRTRVTTIDPATGETTTLLQPAATPTPEQSAADIRTVRESGLLVTGGILLAVPGFITDVFGLLLAIPGVRRGIAARRPVPGSGTVIAGETVIVDDSGVTVTDWRTSGPSPDPASPTVIQGEILPPTRRTDPNE